MFLVEPRAGERCHYPSARALGAAIRRGELGPHARIFHQTTSRWLPITVHPEYRQLELERQELSARIFEDRQWTFLARRPEPSNSEGLFAPIPGPRIAPRMVMIHREQPPSWLGLAVRRVLQLARTGM
jgi:hypothetical protein